MSLNRVEDFFIADVGSTSAASQLCARRRMPSTASWATIIELLVVGNCMLRKNDQNAALKIDYKAEFEPD
jgi:hypothetical protein